MSAAPRFKRLEIEWLHYMAGDATCNRCENTGRALETIVSELRQEFGPAGVKINLTKKFLDRTRIAESNEIRINGTPIEELLAASVIATDCPSCSTLAGESTFCRAVVIGDQQFEEITADLIRTAAYRALGII